MNTAASYGEYYYITVTQYSYMRTIVLNSNSPTE
jgi:hypothetical protein